MIQSDFVQKITNLSWKSIKFFMFMIPFKTNKLTEINISLELPTKTHKKKTKINTSPNDF